MWFFNNKNKDNKSSPKWLEWIVGGFLVYAAFIHFTRPQNIAEKANKRVILEANKRKINTIIVENKDIAAQHNISEKLIKIKKIKNNDNIENISQKNEKKPMQESIEKDEILQELRGINSSLKSIAHILEKLIEVQK